MSIEDRVRWDGKYAERTPPSTLTPSPWLRDVLAQIPVGDACELACGMGDNALLLAQEGWSVDAVDVSAIGLQRAESQAQMSGLSVNWIAADLDTWQPAGGAYDLVTVFRFLDRRSVPRIVRQGLKAGGWLVYETFGGNHLSRTDAHMRNPEFVLQPGELLQLFPDFEVIEATEISLPDGDFARFLGRRRTA